MDRLARTAGGGTLGGEAPKAGLLGENGPVTRIAIIGGGPGGYEAAHVAVGLGAEVMIIDHDGLGGACVLTDCVPSKTLIASSARVSAIRDAHELGLAISDTSAIDLKAVNQRVKALARAQSEDIHQRLLREGVTVVSGFARFAAKQGTRTYVLDIGDDEGNSIDSIEADIVLIASGSTPRELPGSETDGERILSWRDVYELDELPEHLIVVGSGVTGAEFASAYSEIGVAVTLVSSRDRVLPGEDPDAADVIEQVFTSRGGKLEKNARAKSVRRSGDGVVCELGDGQIVTGSHALMCVGSIPNTANLGLDNVGVHLDGRGYVKVDRVSRTNVGSIYAAGDCTGVLPLASVAGMQGRIAMWHALGEAVSPLRLRTVAANIFTHPEIATVGIGHESSTAGPIPARTVMLPLATNARAKMEGMVEGFIKVHCRAATGVVLGGTVVAPNASELIFPLTLAVQKGLNVSDLAATIGVYPSLSGSLAEASRRLMEHDDLE